MGHNLSGICSQEEVTHPVSEFTQSRIFITCLLGFYPGKFPEANGKGVSYTAP